MKKIILGIVTALLLLVAVPVAYAEEEESDLVKVYIFYKDGCTYCEYQVEYLESLESYNVKFEIVELQLYDSSWASGEYYELGETVANAFYSAGFTGAAINGTPFVVVSNIYASTGYNAELDEVIDEAYEEGDADVVGCFMEGNTDCLDGVVYEEESSDDSSNGVIIAVICIIGIAGAAGIIYVGVKK